MVVIPVAGDNFAKIDYRDLDRVSGFKWHRGVRGYILTSIWDALQKKTSSKYLHRFLLDAPDDVEVDHINGDPSDNTRKNLRLCTRQQNAQNKILRSLAGKSSRFKGVTVSRGNPHKWYANIRANGKTLYLGTFYSEETAAHAYDEAAKKYYGEFASPNFKQVA